MRDQSTTSCLEGAGPGQSEAKGAPPEDCVLVRRANPGQSTAAYLPTGPEAVRHRLIQEPRLGAADLELDETAVERWRIAAEPFEVKLPRIDVLPDAHVTTRRRRARRSRTASC